MTLTDISYQNFESTAYQAIFDVINNRNNIADPRDSSGARTFVYDADPVLTKGLGFNGFPYIVVELPLLDYSNPTIKGDIKEIMFRYKILVRTARDGSGNTRKDQGRTDVLAIGDALQKTVNSMAVRALWNAAGANQFDLLTNGTGIAIIDQKQLYETTYTLTTWNRFQIT